MNGRVFYRIDSSRVSLREYWWGTRSPAVVIAALLKLLRVRLPSATDDPCVESLTPFEVECHQVPEEVRSRFAPLLRQLEQLGFASPIWHAIEDDLHHVQTYLATAALGTGRAWARVHERIWHLHTPPRTTLFVEIVSELANGRFLWSLSSKPDLAAPPECTVLRRKDARPAALWIGHRAALSSQPVVAATETEELRGSMERLHAAVRDFHLRRGVFRPTSAAEKLDAETNQADRQAAGEAGSKHPEVLAEIQRLQRATASWASALLMLLASAAVFLGLGGIGGAGGMSTRMLIALLPILLFHETGHWLAMRVFGYRNLRMFFIPFFGAAVSGQHYNVAGWKKAVVSLMGPLPGIVVGGVLGAAGMALEQRGLVEAGLMTVVLNGFNLLPFLPLDGGWALQAILFSRHLVLEVVFRALAVLGLAGLALWSRDPVLGVLAGVMLLSLPTSFKLARITREFRHSELEPVSPDAQTIPAAQAEAIVTRIKEQFPSRLPTKQAAQHTLTVFESLNARPPGALGSLAIAALHGAGIVAAVVFAAVFVVAGQTSLGTLLDTAATLPQRKLDPAGLELRPAASPLPPGQPHDTLVASFAGAAQARAAFLDLQAAPEAPPLQLFGESLLISVPPGDETALGQWRAQLQSRASNVFVATPRTSTGLQLSCLARDASSASMLESELGDYFLAAGMHVVPPWAAADARTPEERTRHAAARRTYGRVLQVQITAFQDPQAVALLRQLAEAHRRQDAAEIARLGGERRRLGLALRKQKLAGLGEGAGVDQEVLKRYEALLTSEADFVDPVRARAELGPLLGQLELVDGEPKDDAAAATATGTLLRAGLLLHMPYLRFQDAFDGPPLMVHWLHERGCSDFRYDLGPGFDLEEAEVEED